MSSVDGDVDVDGDVESDGYNCNSYKQSKEQNWSVVK